jgi:aspartate carbamoyltransferase catalytic subunit
VNHLLSTHDLSIEEIVQLLELADHMAEINSRAVPKVPALRGKTIASVFFEDARDSVLKQQRSDCRQK